MSIYFPGTDLLTKYTTTVNNFPAHEDPVSVTCWLKLSTTLTRQAVIALNASGTYTTTLGYSTSTSNLSCWSLTNTTIVSTPFPGVNQWIFIAYTFDGTTHSMSTNDGSRTTATPTMAPGAVSSVQIGSDSFSDVINSGYIEDLRVYDRALSASEVSTIYNSGGTDYILDGLIFWLPMNQFYDGQTIDASSMKDFSQYGHVISLTGTAPVGAVGVTDTIRRAYM